MTRTVTVPIPIPHFIWAQKEKLFQGFSRRERLELLGHPSTLESYAIQSVAISMFVYESHQVANTPVVDPDPALCRALADHTDLLDMIHDSLPPLPYDAIWFVFPHGFDVYLGKKEHNECFRMSGAYVVKFGESFLFYFWAPAPKSRGKGDDRYAHVLMHPGDDIIRRISGEWRESTITPDNDLEVTDSLMTQEEKDHMLRAQRMIIGMLHYLTCDNGIRESVDYQHRLQESGFVPDSKSKNKGKPRGKDSLHRQWLDRFGHGTVIRVGHGWSSSDDGKAFQDSESSDPTSSQPSVRRHWVRGHFRMQPYGPKGSLRRKIWLPPFQRGEGEISSGITVKVK